MERAAAARILAQREIEMERVSESESEYVPRRRRMARMDGGEMRMRIERLICHVEICHVGVRGEALTGGWHRRLHKLEHFRRGNVGRPCA